MDKLIKRIDDVELRQDKNGYYYIKLNSKIDKLDIGWLTDMNDKLNIILKDILRIE